MPPTEILAELTLYAWLQDSREGPCHVELRAEGLLRGQGCGRVCSPYKAVVKRASRIHPF